MNEEEFSEETQSSKFTGFINPVLSLIDNGTIYRKGFLALYFFSAIICLLFALILFILIFTIISDLKFGTGFGIFLSWFACTFACWLEFQVFWNRMKKIDSLFKENDDFVAAPLIADYIKTCGECIFVGSVGSIPCLILLGIITTISPELKYIIPIADVGGIVGSILFSILTIVLGYLSMLVLKFISETITAFASIANNTKKLDKSLPSAARETP